jgi:outer membrane immunogenic protein
VSSSLSIRSSAISFVIAALPGIANAQEAQLKDLDARIAALERVVVQQRIAVRKLEEKNAGLRVRLGERRARVEQPGRSERMLVTERATEMHTMHTKAPVLAANEPSALPSSWPGFYIGAHGGYGWDHDPFQTTTTFTPPVSLSGFGSAGYVAGGHAGFNWQRGALVGGIEVDLSASGIEGATTATSTAPVTGGSATITYHITDKFQYLATARARLGVTPWPTLLLYGTAGPAWARFTQSMTINFVNTGTFPNSTYQAFDNPSDRFGLSVGLGAEASLSPFGMPGWFIRTEYLHYDFGSQANSLTITANATSSSSSRSTTGHLTADVVRGGVSFAFQ